MKQMIRRVALLAALPIAIAAAHDDINNFEAVQWKCWDIPTLLHRQKVDQQGFQISNVGGTAVHWWFLAMDPLGEYIVNQALLSGVNWGDLEPYRTVYVTNSDLYAPDTPENTPEEALALCFRNGNHEPRGRFFGYVTVREHRRIGAEWVAFDVSLNQYWEWWSVLPKIGVDATAAAKITPEKP